MSGNRRRIRMPEGNILRGLLRLARGDAGGLREFGNGTPQFSASLAPLLAFPLVGSALFGLEGHWMLALVMLLSRVSGVLMQPVVTEAAASRVGSRATWMMTSTALNWSVWLIFPLILIGVLISDGLITLGLPQNDAVGIAVAAILLYLMWFQYFILRNGLRLRLWPAIGLVVLMNVAVTSVYLAPYLFHPSLLHLTLHPSPAHAPGSG